MNNPAILIIDDEAQIRRLLEITLESNGFKVESAETAKEGLRIAANHPPDLIILDLGLPDENGHSVLKKLREWYTKPIIILSVQSSEDDIVKKNNEIVKLTATEYKLISLLAQHEGKVLTHQYLLREVWGPGYINQSQYLRVFIAQLRKKVEADANRPEHILTESGVGYRFIAKE